MSVPEGTLEFASAGTDRWARARGAMGLAPGDWLRTRESPARVVFDSGTVLYANGFTTLMLLTDATPGLGGGAPGLSMLSGEVYIETAARDSGLCVHTPHGRAADIGTRFAVDVAPEGTTVVVAEGFVQASTDAGTVAVAAEQEVVLEGLTSRPGEVRPVLDLDERLAWTRAFDGPAEPVVVPEAPEPKLAVTSFTLMDADMDLPIEGFDPMPDGAVLNLSLLPTRSLNIRANVTPPVVGSVRFVLAGRMSTVEEVAPYSLHGDTKGDYRGWTPDPGTYTLTATPSSGFRASGRRGEPLTVEFRVVGGGESK